MRYRCVFCHKLYQSPNGTGSDVQCCAEVGRVTKIPDGVEYPEFCGQPEKCAGLSRCPRDPICCD